MTDINVQAFARRKSNRPASELDGPVGFKLQQIVDNAYATDNRPLAGEVGSSLKKKPNVDRLSQMQDGSSQKSGRRTVKFEQFSNDAVSDGEEIVLTGPLASPRRLPQISVHDTSESQKSFMARMRSHQLLGSSSISNNK